MSVFGSFIGMDGMTVRKCSFHSFVPNYQCAFGLHVERVFLCFAEKWWVPCTVHKTRKYEIQQKKPLKLGPTQYYLYLKIILLQCFQFLVFSNKQYTNRPLFSIFWWKIYSFKDINRNTKLSLCWKKNQIKDEWYYSKVICFIHFIPPFIKYQSCQRRIHHNPSISLL